MTLPSPYMVGSAWGLSEACLSLLKRSKSNATSQDRGSLGLIWVVNLAAVGMGIFLAYNLRTWALPWREPVYVAGFGLFLAGLCLRWYSIFYLGRFFTVNVAIAADHQLINSGPYRLIRHPSYTGGLLMALGLGLCIGNLASLLVIFVPSLCVSLWRIHIEEDVLARAFGGSYDAYMQSTKRLIPFVY